MADTIFSRILRGEIPCARVYEDEHVLAFLDIGPLSRGHTLVIPKEPAATLDQLSDEAAAAIGRVLPRLCRAVMAATGTPRLQRPAEQRRARPPGRRSTSTSTSSRKPEGGGGLGHRLAGRPARPAAAAELAAKIAAALL